MKSSSQNFPLSKITCQKIPLVLLINRHIIRPVLHYEGWSIHENRNPRQPERRCTR